MQDWDINLRRKYDWNPRKIKEIFRSYLDLYNQEAYIWTYYAEQSE